MIESLLQSLEYKGWFETKDFINSTLANDLRNDLLAKYSNDLFSKARIGRSLQLKEVTSIRTDEICWIENWQENFAISEYRNLVNTLINSVSRHFFLTLKSFEAHYSHYSAGSFYKKHIDQHLETRHRQLTIVTYLSDNIGGKLVVYSRDDKNKVEASISPEIGKTVIFFSSQIFHEVLPCLEDRIAITGWVRDNENLNGLIL